MSENKNEFIRNIFELNHDSQAVLKELVERVLERAVDISDHVEANESQQEDSQSGNEPIDEKHDDHSNAAVEEELIR